MLFGGGNSGVVGADIRQGKQEFIFKSIFITTERPLGAGGTTPTQMPSIQVKRRARRMQRSRRRQPSYVDLRIVYVDFIYFQRKGRLKKRRGFSLKCLFSDAGREGKEGWREGNEDGGGRGSWGGREA